MLTNSVGVPGRLIPALLADRFFGAFNVLLPFVFFTCATMYLWIAVHDSSSMFAFTAFYGFGANAIQTLFISALASFITDPSRAGVRIGMVFTIISFACLTGPPIAGTLIQHEGGSFLGAQIFGGTTMLCGGVILLAARWTQMRARGLSEI